MRVHRFYVDHPLTVGATIDLPATVAHHALRVLRLRDRALIVLFDNRGSEFAATLIAAGDGARAQLVSEATPFTESPLPLTLVQSWTASDKLDWLVEKAVELGVRALVLTPARRAVVQLEGERLQRRLARLREIAIGAACQSGRVRLATIDAAPTLEQALQRGTQAGAHGFVLDPEATGTLAGANASSGCTIAIGPEGGFDAQELALAARLGYGARRLGPRILRTETAGLVALALLQASAGDLGS